MAEQQIRFDDGASYERMMGIWSRLIGDVFIDWLAPRAGLRWVDIGCGSGALTELLIERCAPAGIHGIDPSEAQLAFARTRPAARMAEFRQGDAMALPFSEDNFDAAVLALVIFFVPEPAKGVAEMVRVVCSGGMVATYVRDASPPVRALTQSTVACQIARIGWGYWAVDEVSVRVGWIIGMVDTCVWR